MACVWRGSARWAPCSRCVCVGVERIRTANTLLERKLKRVKVVLLFCMLMHAMFVLHMHMCVYPRPTCKQTSAVLETCWSGVGAGEAYRCFDGQRRASCEAFRAMYVCLIQDWTPTAPVNNLGYSLSQHVLHHCMVQLTSTLEKCIL